MIEGNLYSARVDVVDVAVGTEGVALRAALDQFPVVTRRFTIGQARHLIALLSGAEPTYEYVVICCHGDDGAILLPKLSPRFEAMQPIHGALTAAALRGRVQMPDRVVIATGCGTGNDELGHAFLEGGCAAYIGPSRGPYGHSVVVAVTLLFYELTQGRTLQDAVAKVQSVDDELSMWRLWQRQPEG